MTDHIYLDNAATTRVRPEVVAVMTKTMQTNYGNPSSPHQLGLAAEEAVRQARSELATVLGVKRDAIVFTSGGTEANNLAVVGAANAHCRPGDNIIVPKTEHPSVLAAAKACQANAVEVRFVDVQSTGEVSPQDLAALVDERTRLFTIAHVNNEVGTIQPIRNLIRVARTRNPGLIVHVDAVQSFARLPVRPLEWGADLVSVSAHKIHGPKGIGALYVRKGVRLLPLVVGGGQEHGLRSGTENVPGIVGFGEAARLGTTTMATLKPWPRVFFELLRSRIPGVTTVGPDVGTGAPHIINVRLPRIKGEVAVRMLSDLGVYVSTGSACSTKQHALSHVLLALGLTPEQIDTSLRVSFSFETTEEDVHTAVSRIVNVQRNFAAWHE